MKCTKCGYEYEEGISFCPRCGNYLKSIIADEFSNNDELINRDAYLDQIQNTNIQNSKMVSFQKQKRSSKMDSIIVLIVLCLWGIGIFFLVKELKKDNSYYFENNKETNTSDDSSIEQENQGISKSGYNGIRTSEDKTAIIFDNQYFKQIMLNGKEDVLKLVKSDSKYQKKNCPQAMLTIENDIEKLYGITAVNLCEMDLNFARELRSVASYIYKNFPEARGYITNLTLANVEDSASYMAAFMPMFTFVTSNTSSGYPLGVKTQIILNTKYFLNPAKINNSVTYGAKIGYFPKGATRSSTVAHEFGHYLSYVAMLNYYHVDQMTYITSSKSTLMMSIYNDFNAGDFSYKLLQEAFNEYRQYYGSGQTFDNFRSSISSYAMAKDDKGQYIYDETIAEAFHDCYLNGNNANLASQLILKTLKKYL